MTIESWLLLGILICFLFNVAGGVRMQIQGMRNDKKNKAEIDKCALRIRAIDRAKLLLDTAKVWNNIGDQEAVGRIMAEVDEIQRTLNEDRR